jgi:hypothetical protein
MTKDVSNAETEDFLTEDPDIPSQRYVLLSFLSPENVLARKDLFFFEEFMKTYEIEWKVKNLEQFLADTVNSINKKIDASYVKLIEANLATEAELVRESKLSLDSVLGNYQEFVRKNNKEITASKIKEAYDDFIYKHGKRIEDDFFAKNNFQTTVRGLKIRGTYGSQEEAVARSKKLQRNDPIHNIFVGEVGKWLPWDPNPKDIAEQEYAEEQLNQLMKGYKQNEEAREKFYQENPALKGKKTEKGVTPMFGMSKAEDEANGDGVVDIGDANKALFEGPADLAMERKREKAAE